MIESMIELYIENNTEESNRYIMRRESFNAWKKNKKYERINYIGRIKSIQGNLLMSEIKIRFGVKG